MSSVWTYVSDRLIFPSIKPNFLESTSYRGCVVMLESFTQIKYYKGYDILGVDLVDAAEKIK